MSDRLVELALEALESRKAAIEAEIQQLRDGEPTKVEHKVRGRRPVRSKAINLVSSRVAARRAAHSQRMKDYWARRRAQKSA